jgi:uncharacterized protein
MSQKPDHHHSHHDHKDWTRRGFLKTAGTIGLGSLMAAYGHHATAAPPPKTQAGEPFTVPERPFGKTGQMVSILSLGGMFDIPNNQLLLKQAVKWGVTYWDTANSYEGGRSEKGIGKYFDKYPEDRKKIFLVTKTGAWTTGGMTEHLETSLERMQTDTIDLLFVHGIRSISTMDGDIKAWSEKAKASGKLRFFGFSTHSNMENCLLEAAKLGWVDGIMMSYNYRLMQTDQMRAAVDACSKAGIGLTAMKTQAGGPVKTETETELRLAGRFLEKGFMDGQAKLKAVWENPQIASICSQMDSMKLLKANAAAASDPTSLSGEEMRLFERHALATADQYCAGCHDICQAAVGARVPVGDLMRCHMYCRSYGRSDWARAHFETLSAETRRQMSLADYSEAERRCPQKMPIARLMREALDDFG